MAKLRSTNIYGDLSVTGDVKISGNEVATQTWVTNTAKAKSAGAADTAAKLTTARTIGGVSFDGSANINLPGVNTAGTQNTTGNAATATKLATARTIGGVSFNGSANISLPGVNTAGNQNTTGNAATATKLATARTIGGVSFDGTANISLPGVNTAGNQNTTGSAAKLTTARTIGGVSFDGTANINLPGVNTAGNQNTTGKAATATKLATARTIGGVSFDGSANINLPGVNTAGNQNTTGKAADADKLDNQDGSYYDHRTYNGANNYLGGYYTSGGPEKPNNAIFGSGKLKLAMLGGSNLGVGGTWNDVLWLSGYTGNDVKGSHALIFDKSSTDIFVADVNYDATSWGTPVKLFHTGNLTAATASSSGLLSTGTQTISGSKTFNSTVNIGSSANLNFLSDRRLKNINREINSKGYLERISDIPVYNFSYKSNLNKDMIGIMAQDIVEKMPEIQDMLVDVDSYNEETQLDNQLSIKHDGLVYMLMLGLQEANKRIKDLEELIYNGKNS